jgi:hypothetical protein
MACQTLHPGLRPFWHTVGDRAADPSEPARIGSRCSRCGAIVEAPVLKLIDGCERCLSPRLETK